MTTEKSMHTMRYNTLSHLHVIVLYLLIGSLTLAWGIYFVYFSRNVRTHVKSTYEELNLIKERLKAFESTQVIIAANANEYDTLRRQARHTRIKMKHINNREWQQKQRPKQDHQQKQHSNLVYGSIHFKVPVRTSDLFKLDLIRKSLIASSNDNILH